MAKITFIMLKPDAIQRHLENELLAMFADKGIHVVKAKTVVVAEPLILAHYAEVIQRVNIPDFEDRIRKEFVGKTVRVFEMTSDSDDLIHEVRELIGVTDPAKAGKDTIRGKYAMDSMEDASKEKRMLRNLIHASDTEENAQREIELWFGYDSAK
jgi:nucleoside-diphosphate kinase